MSDYRHLELLGRGPVSVVRLLNPKYFPDDEVAGLTREWNSVADRADCRTLIVDCSNVQILSSAMLSRLIVLQRRLKQKRGMLILCGLCSEVRRSLRCTKLDCFFEIREDERQEAVALA
jgi:anti-sigma B factor antagonist